MNFCVLCLYQPEVKTTTGRSQWNASCDYDVPVDINSHSQDGAGSTQPDYDVPSTTTPVTSHGAAESASGSRRRREVPRPPVRPTAATANNLGSRGDVNVVGSTAAGGLDDYDMPRHQQLLCRSPSDTGGDGATTAVPFSSVCRDVHQILDDIKTLLPRFECCNLLK